VCEQIVSLKQLLLLLLGLLLEPAAHGITRQ
jgi:hypothetical protein